MPRSVYYFTDAQQVGGAERALLTLLESIDTSRWQPTLLYHSDASARPLAERAVEMGVPVRSVERLPLGPTGAWRVPRLARELHAAAPAVFHAHLSWPLAAKYALVAAVLARIPAVVATIHLFPDFTVDRSNRLQLQLLARFVRRYIAVSHDIARRLTGELRLPAARIDVVHNGIFLERFVHPGESGLRAELSGERGGTVFLTVARLDEQKGLDVLVRAATRFADVRFVLAGEGPERRRLVALAEELGVGDRVLFLGQRSDIPALLTAADALVLPSRYEGSPLAVLEAMAAGKAVVGSAIGGIDELVVHGETGLLVPPGDAEALAAALRAVAADPSLRARLGAAARERAERYFSASASTRRVERIYEELLDRTGSRRR